MAFRRYSGGTCATCGDTAVSVRVLELRGADALVLHEGAAGQSTCTVTATLIDNLKVGDTLLVHAGVAIARVETL